MDFSTNLSILMSNWGTSSQLECSIPDDATLQLLLIKALLTHHLPQPQPPRPPSHLPPLPQPMPPQAAYVPHRTNQSIHPINKNRIKTVRKPHPYLTLPFSNTPSPSALTSNRVPISLKVAPSHHLCRPLLTREWEVRSELELMAWRYRCDRCILV